jgi:NADH-quinone oxidoreductase subunit L
MPVALFVWVCGTLAAFFTAFYMARQVFMVFGGPPQTDAARHAPESAPVMVYPLAVLAFFAAVLGFVGVHEEFPVLGPALGNPFHHFVGSLPFGHEPFGVVPFSALPALISIGVAVLGWGLGWALYGRSPARSRAADPLRRLGRLWNVVHHKYYVDEIYQATVVRGTVAFSNLNGVLDSRMVDGTVNAVGKGGALFGVVNGWVDTHIVDGLVNLVGVVHMESARGLRWLQSGRVQQYAMILFVSLLALLGAFAF